MGACRARNGALQRSALARGWRAGVSGQKGKPGPHSHLLDIANSFVMPVRPSDARAKRRKEPKGLLSQRLFPTRAGRSRQCIRAASRPPVLLGHSRTGCAGEGLPPHFPASGCLRLSQSVPAGPDRLSFIRGSLGHETLIARPDARTTKDRRKPRAAFRQVPS